MTDLERRVIESRIEYREATEAEPDRLSGYAAVFDTETVIGGSFREVVRPGAFTDAIARDDVRALFNHDPNYVLGRLLAGTLSLSVDERGLRYDVTPPSTTWAKDLVISVKRGDVTQSSFAFRVTKDDWQMPATRDELPLRRIEQVELYDVSPVTYPAYTATTVSVRAMAQSQRDVEVPDRAQQARLRNRLTRAERELTRSER